MIRRASWKTSGPRQGRYSLEGSDRLRLGHFLGGFAGTHGHPRAQQARNLWQRWRWLVSIRSTDLAVWPAVKRPAMLDMSLGVPAVGLLLAVATLAQISAGLMQARKGGTSMIKKIRVICSSLMLTVSSVLINLATASSATPNVDPSAA